MRTRVPLQSCAQDAAPRPPPRRITDECRACRRRRHAAAALEAPNPSPFRRALRGAQRHDKAGSRVGRAWPGAARRAGRRRLRPRVFQHWTAPVAGITARRRGGLRPGGRGTVRRCPQTPGCNVLTKPSANIRAELRPRYPPVELKLGGNVLGTLSNPGMCAKAARSAAVTTHLEALPAKWRPAGAAARRPAARSAPPAARRRVLPRGGPGWAPWPRARQERSQSNDWCRHTYSRLELELFFFKSLNVEKCMCHSFHTAARCKWKG